MLAVTSGWSSEGDESVNADDGPDEAATTSAASAAAARTLPGTRRETMLFSSMLLPT
jgi:hypothetical protein